ESSPPKPTSATSRPSKAAVDDGVAQLGRLDIVSGNAGIESFAPTHPWVQPVDISNALLWLSTDEARYITGVPLPVDAGLLTK
ncbi:MAG TPA: hypothetical protein VK024_01640, partial [Actinomycetaceae bacterium]|nr:hypothetical protein [Actinomycetaceae bacterium]